MSGDSSKQIARLAAATLAGWAGLLLYFYFSGRLNTYLAPTFRPYVLVAGVILAVMAFLQLAAPYALHECEESSCSHRSRVSTCVRWLTLAIPVIIALRADDTSTFSATMVRNRGDGISPAELSNFRTAARRREDALFPMPRPNGSSAEVIGEDSTGSALEWADRNEDGIPKLEIMDLYFASQDLGLRTDFEGHEIELIGQMLPTPSLPHQPPRFKCVRLFMSCCAADGKPIAVYIECQSLPAVAEMAWVKIVGVPEFPVERGRRIPMIKAVRVSACAAPAEPFHFTN